MTEGEIRDNEWVTAMATTEPTTGRTVLPGVPPFTVDDLLKFPDDGNRYELSNGSLLVSPAPLPLHQLVITQIIWILRKTKIAGLVPLTTVNLRVSDSDYYIPDLAVADIRSVRSGELMLAPRDVKLAVEVVSPSTKDRDRIWKTAAYAAAGIPMYWRVEVGGEPAVYVHELDGETYGPPAVYKAGTMVTLQSPYPISFDPAELFEE
ncbi:MULTISPECIES: Uma2 family endonuclease [unclassified Nonomuraea]|uniref:Uma2 family endonuclease n=1 Tax=unclassified Nonomuraea TaxID=2593643 RepID=UPI003406D356